MIDDSLSAILKELRIGSSSSLGDQLSAVYLYGSRARGDAKYDSDIDVLVILRGNFDYFMMIERTGALAANLSLKYETVISLAFASEDQFVAKNSPFLINVHREAVVI